MELNLVSATAKFETKQSKLQSKANKTRPVVRSRLLLPNRRRLILAQPAQRLRRAYQIRRLDPRYLLRAGNAGYQLD
jgi:hypothetical protein